VVVTGFVPTSSIAGWTDGLPSSGVLIKSATVVTSSGSQYTVDGGASYYNTKYNDTWQIQQAMACIYNNWDCTDKQVPIQITSTEAISYEAYISIGGVKQVPSVTGSFGNSGGSISLTFTINGIAWQESTVALAIKTKNGTTTYTLPKTGLSVSI
jgi:hypothetical protein